MSLAIALPQRGTVCHRPVPVARSYMTRGRAGEEAIRIVVICVSPVCLSVGRYHFINYRGGGGGGGVSRRRGGSAGRFSVCQCIAGGVVRRATPAVMRFCRGGGCGDCGSCGMSDSPVGGGATRPRSCHLSAGEYDMSHMCARCSVAAKKETLTCNTKIQHKIHHTNMHLLNATVDRIRVQRVCAVW